MNKPKMIPNQNHRILTKSQALSFRPKIRNLTKDEQLKFFNDLSAKDPELAAEIAKNYYFLARDNQLPPNNDDWFLWLIMTGRRFGKTWTGANFIRARIEEGLAKNIFIIGPTTAMARRNMVEGPSGILNVFPDSRKPRYISNRGEIEFYNGAKAIVLTGEEPDKVRGQGVDTVWFDELAFFEYPKSIFDATMLCLSSNNAKPKVIITTTPQKNKLIKSLIKDCNSKPNYYRTNGTLYDNMASFNDDYAKLITDRFVGSRFGKEEIFGELSDDNDNDLFREEDIEKNRVTIHPKLTKVVVGVDPATTTKINSDLTGIIAAGLGIDGHVYILEDKSGKFNPNTWANISIQLCKQYNAEIVIESNQGGDMTKNTIMQIDNSIKIKTIHAKTGKATRAEPVSILYQRNQVHHVGLFEKLEEQMVNFDGNSVSSDDEDSPRGKSPDRMDALVYAVMELKPAKHTVYRNTTFAPYF